MTSTHVQETQNHCGNNCRYTRSGESTVHIHFKADGTVSAEDAGAYTDALKSAGGTSHASTSWSRRWDGEWHAEDKVIRVKLKPIEATCNQDPPAETPSTCRQAREIHLRCRRSTLPLVRPRGAGAKALACRSRGLRRAEGMSTPPWVFGVEDPLVVLDGGTRHVPTRRYALAKAAAAKTKKTANR